MIKLLLIFIPFIISVPVGNLYEISKTTLCVIRPGFTIRDGEMQERQYSGGRKLYSGGYGKRQRLRQWQPGAKLRFGYHACLDLRQ
jgi:hypothetical protein